MAMHSRQDSGLIGWLEAVVEGRRARWLSRLVRAAVVVAGLGTVGLIVATHVSAPGVADETIQTISAGRCSASLVYRPTLLLYGHVFLDVRRDGRQLARTRVTQVDAADEPPALTLSQPTATTLAVRHLDTYATAEALPLPDACLR